MFVLFGAYYGPEWALRDFIPGPQPTNRPKGRAQNTAHLRDGLGFGLWALWAIERSTPDYQIQFPRYSTQSDILHSFSRLLLHQIPFTFLSFLLHEKMKPSTCITL
ncbi:hypothetical protein VN97_g8643 [Penicillium thymicola]|uniref:Uncharacterized protein n=1 Tax=Penicillium thymicola TaxID=293382 RepID=A0AAI9X692_PENTH|nr:hypothetical protein VN97_g8643 [Penicillium thymicola]